MIILKEINSRKEYIVRNNLNSNMIILKAYPILEVSGTTSIFKFQYDNT